MKYKIALFAAVLVMVSLLSGCGAVVKQEAYSQKTNEAQEREKEKNISNDSEPIGYEIIRKVSENEDTNEAIGVRLSNMQIK